MHGRTAVHVVSDGTIKLDGGVVFGQVPKNQWQAWLPADRRNRVRLGMNCLLVRVGERNYLVDTGIGQKHTAEERDDLGLATSQLVGALKKHEVLPQDITGVVLTSLHSEHAGGCTKVDRRGDVVPAFPKAKYYVQRTMFEEASSPNERDGRGYAQDDFMPLARKGVLQLLDGDATIVPGFQVRRTGGPGHGHQIVVVTHGGERVALLGDLVPTPWHLHLRCISASDRQPEETLERKRAILKEALHEGWLLVFSHGVAEQAGYLENRDGRSFLRPVPLS